LYTIFNYIVIKGNIIFWECEFELSRSRGKHHLHHGKTQGIWREAAILDKKSKDLKFDFLSSCNVSTIKNKISRRIQITFKKLFSSFSNYFPSLNAKQDEWVINPFVNCADEWFGSQGFFIRTKTINYMDFCP
jgi:hypothetical protein